MDTVWKGWRDASDYGTFNYDVRVQRGYNFQRRFNNYGGDRIKHAPRFMVRRDLFFHRFTWTVIYWAFNAWGAEVKTETTLLQDAALMIGRMHDERLLNRITINMQATGLVKQEERIEFLEARGFQLCQFIRAHGLEVPELLPTPTPKG